MLTIKRRLVSTLRTRIQRARKLTAMTERKILAKASARSKKAYVRLQTLLAGPAEIDPNDWPLLVWLAEMLKVDPRWLITGEIFQGIELQIEAARPALSRQLATSPVLRAVAVMEILPWPPLAGGVCRYCLCTQECGCGDCYWVDQAATICSACLILEE